MTRMIALGGGDGPGARGPAGVRGAGVQLAGHLTPVFFGSAIKEIGVADLLDGLVDLSAHGPGPSRPIRRIGRRRTRRSLTALVFKIQANMDPNHRDRIAFARVCSGQAGAGDAAEARCGPEN